MNRALALALVALVVPLLGCPYTTSRPIAAPSAQGVDQRLVGEWRCVSGDSDETVVMRFTTVGPDELEMTAPSDKENHPMRLHAATLAGKPMLNVEDPKASGDDRWALARATFYRPSLVQFDVAREEPFKKAPKGASERVTAEKALKRGDLFEDGWACVRIESKKP